MNLWSRSILMHANSVPVSIPFAALAARVNVDRGDLVTVLASPAAGKSVFSLNWAAQLGEPSIVLNLDTPTRQQANRMVSLHSHHPYQWVKENPEFSRNYLENKLAFVRGYDVPCRDTKTIHSLVRAETEYWGETPALLVVDNIRNITSDHTYEAFSSAFLGLHHIAMENKICVVVLHHVTRANADMTKPLTAYSGQFAGEQDSSVVLGLWRQPTPHGAGNVNHLNVSILKQREGEFDPSGHDYVTLTYDKATYQLV